MAKRLYAKKRVKRCPVAMNDKNSRKEWHWLNDMREAIEDIHGHPRFSEGRAAFDSDKYYREWLYFKIERLGECASRLRHDFAYEQKHPEIQWRGTTLMRRRIAHEYWRIDPDLVWAGVEYLPKIKDKIDELLKIKELELERIEAHEKPAEQQKTAPSKDKTEFVLPHSEPKTHLEELANKKALKEREQRNRSIEPVPEKQDKEKPAQERKEKDIERDF